MKYYIIAGEASGDLHGANLIRALAQRDPKAEIRYWGGDQMAEACREAGLPAVQVRHISTLAYMGFLEVVTHLKTILHNMRMCKSDLLAFQPDAVIYVDYPGFNLKIARYAHQHGLRNFHYISPQLWAWKKGRIKKMRKILDRLYCILPFEEKFYADNHFAPARYVGHPLLDAVNQFRSNESAASPFPWSADKTIALLPGSRRQELRKVLPQLMEVARRHTDYHFVVAGMSLLGSSIYDELLKSRPDNLTVVYDKTYWLLAHSAAAIVCSGTATLETALFGVPQVVCYRANPISVAIARMVVSRRVRFISLVNLIADQRIVTELIQNDMTDQNLDRELEAIYIDNPKRDAMLEGYAKVREMLGGGGASDRVAEDIIQTIQHQ